MILPKCIILVKGVVIPYVVAVYLFIGTTIYFAIVSDRSLDVNFHKLYIILIVTNIIGYIFVILFLTIIINGYNFIILIVTITIIGYNLLFQLLIVNKFLWIPNVKTKRERCKHW